MLLIVNQAKSAAYNILAVEALRVEGANILLDTDSKMRVIARYKTDREAEEVFRDMLSDLGDISGLPFDECCKTYELPEEKG